MITRSSINLASGDYTGGDAFAVGDGILTVQCEYTGLDGDIDVIPVQTNESSDQNYNAVLDDDGNPIVLRIRPSLAKNATEAGNRTLNLSDLRCITAKVLIKRVGQDAATKGTVNLYIKNSIDET